MSPSQILIVWHSRTGTAEALAAAAAKGAGEAALLKPACDVQPQDLLDASGYLFACPENLATMSGQMKEMFDRCYYPVLGKIEGRPYASIIAAGSDGDGAQRQLDRIAKGWRLKRVADPYIVVTKAQSQAEIEAPKDINRGDIEQAGALGEALAQGLDLGIF